MGTSLELLTIVLLPFLNTDTTAVSFHKDGSVSLATLRSNAYMSNGTKILEQPLIITMKYRLNQHT
jgi:hypothetical protein